MITSRLYPDHGGGALQALRLCQKLAEHNIDPFILTGHPKNKTVEEIVQDVPVVRLPLPRNSGLPVLGYYTKALKFLWSHRKEYDLLHAHAIHHHAYASFFIGRLTGKPSIGKISGLAADLPDRVKRRSLGSLQVRLMSLATRLIVTSQELNAQLIDQGIPKEQVLLIPNGTDTELFAPVTEGERRELRKKLGLSEKALVGVFVGALRHVKGIDVLARAWKHIAAGTIDFQLNLVGPYRRAEHWGIDSNFIEEIRRQFQATDKGNAKVHFVGQVSNVEDYLKVADLFILPSRSEGMPNALLEAMACGLPFVATRLGVVEELASHEQRHYLVPIDNEIALAESIIKLAKDPSCRRKLGQAARRTVEERYSLNAVAKRYVQLYRELLQKSHV